MACKNLFLLYSVFSLCEEPPVLSMLEDFVWSLTISGFVLIINVFYKELHTPKLEQKYIWFFILQNYGKF